MSRKCDKQQQQKKIKEISYVRCCGGKSRPNCDVIVENYHCDVIHVFEVYQVVGVLINNAF